MIRSFVLAAAIVLSAATTSFASGRDLSVTTCRNLDGSVCRTVTGSLRDVMAYEGRGRQVRSQRTVRHVRHQQHVVRQQVAHRRPAAVRRSEPAWVRISTMEVRFHRGTYEIRDVQGVIYRLNCSQARHFTGTINGSGWCFYCTSHIGNPFTIVVGERSGWGGRPTGWWTGHRT